MQFKKFMFRDSSQCAEWHTMDECSVARPATCEARGWVVEENKDYVTIVAVRSTDGWYTLRFSIPVGAIISEEVLEEDEDITIQRIS